VKLTAIRFTAHGSRHVRMGCGMRHAASLDWCSGVCLDGPMSGESVDAINRIGSRVTVKSSLISAGTTVMYEVVTLASGESPADLRVVAPASSPD
jgi:hypothetical protein